MYKSIDKYIDKIFEDVKYIDEFWNEYWLVRNLQFALDNKKWQCN